MNPTCSAWDHDHDEGCTRDAVVSIRTGPSEQDVTFLCSLHLTGATSQAFANLEVQRGELINQRDAATRELNKRLDLEESGGPS